MEVNYSHSPTEELLPKFGFGRAHDAVGLLHVGPAVARVVHLQAIVELIQVLLHFLDLLPGHVLQTEAHLGATARGHG